MRGTGRRLARLAGALGALSLCAPALASAAPQPRIINGTPADDGEYPAQGYLELDTSDGTFACGGTLISAKHFLTAAHCATEPASEIALPPSAFEVRLGSSDRRTGTAFSVSRNRVHSDYNATSIDSDVAMLTLSTPTGLTPLRLIRTSETALWKPDVDDATIIGWGKTSNLETNTGSNVLLEAQVPIRSDADCGDPLAYGSDFHAATMVCAGDGSADTCSGDSGGPLMVSDGSAFVLAGITSWGDLTCNHPTWPGVYTRLGSPALNAWVRGGRAELEISQSPNSPTAAAHVTFTATSQGSSAYTWDLDDDGEFDDANGASASGTFAAGGHRVSLRAVDAEGEPAERERTVIVTPAPRPVPDPTPSPTATPVPAPVITTPIPLPRGQLATILTSGRPKVRRGRFGFRIAFAREAPSGIAVVEVFRGRRKIGIARTGVRRGGSKRVTVKLTPTGRRLLRRSSTNRLRVKVRVRVGRRVLRSTTLTLRR